MRILVIGGTRFMGPKIVQQLVEQGHQVAVFNRGKVSIKLPEGVQAFIGDRRNLLDYKEMLRSYAPEIVIDMVLVTEKDAVDLMAVFKGVARRVIAISSCDVYRAYGRLIGKEPGSPDAVPLSEDSPLREKLYPYRQENALPSTDPMKWTDEYDKILVERAAFSNPDLPATVLRLPMVYGPNDFQRRFLSYVKPVMDNRPAILMEAKVAHWRTSMGYVDNVAHAITLAATDDRAARRIYNVAEIDAPSQQAWAQKITDLMGWQGEIKVLATDKLPEDMRSPMFFEQDLVIDSHRIRAELGYAEIVSAEDALRRTAQWEHDNPPAEIDPAQFDYAAEDQVLATLENGG